MCGYGDTTFDFETERLEAVGCAVMEGELEEPKEPEEVTVQ